MLFEVPLRKINPNRLSVAFTWDDNQYRHAEMIAPLFAKHGLRCSFYIVPGESTFHSNFSKSYAELGVNGFEIGSHSYSHRHMGYMVESEAENEFRLAVNKILEATGKYPITFAFPHHSYNGLLLNQARTFHLEARNDLHNSKRFSIKRFTLAADLQNAIETAIALKYNVIFSGHSILTDQEYLNGESGEGYEPMRISVLETFLSNLSVFNEKVEVITFAQAALKEFLKMHDCLRDNMVVIAPNIMAQMETVGLNKEILNSLL